MSDSLPYPLAAGGECPDCGSNNTIHDLIHGHRVCEDCGNLWALDENDPDYKAFDFGACCACGEQAPMTRNILMLNKRAPVPGSGWGCVGCNLDSDGALAVVCDRCLEAEAPLRFACQGFPAEKQRIAIALLQGSFEHNMEPHERDMKNLPF